MIDKKHITKIWNSFNNIKEILHFCEMPEFDIIQASICCAVIGRVDSSTGKFVSFVEDFYLKNKNILTLERLDASIRKIVNGCMFYNVSGYTLSSVIVSNQSIDITFNSYLQGFSRNVQEILYGLDFDKHVAVLQRRSMFLADVLRILADLDLSEDNVTDEEFTSLIVSFFSKDNISASYGMPVASAPLRTLITECLFSNDSFKSEGGEISIYNPASGTGCLLLSAVEKLLSLKYDKGSIRICGQEIDTTLSSISKTLVLFNGLERAEIEHGDTLADDHYNNDKFQYMLADLPFGNRWKDIRNLIVHNSFNDNSLCYYGLPNNVNDSQFLFINKMLSKMDVSGSRIAFLSSGSILWSGNTKSGENLIRRRLFENDMVETIISLPNNTLQFTSIHVCLWVLTNKKDNVRKGKVQLIQVPQPQQVKKGKSVLTQEIVKDILREYKNFSDSDISKIVSNDKFGAYELNVLIGDKKETISISLDTDVEKYVNENVSPYHNEEVIIDYGSVEKRYKIIFEEFFVKETNKPKSIKKAENKVFSLIDEMTSLKKGIKDFDACLKGISLNKSNDNITEERSNRSSYTAVMPLNSFANIVKGQSMKRHSLDMNKELPYIDVNYLRGKSKRTIRDYSYSKISTSDDVLIISNGANAGEVFCGTEGVVSSSLILVKADKNIIVPRYLYYLMKAYEDDFRDIASVGTSIGSLNLSSLKSFSCTLPSIDVQEHIIRELDIVIKKIDNILGLLGNKDNMLSEYRQILIERTILG